MEFQMNNRPLRLFGEIQTEYYLEQFCIWLSILIECGQNDVSIGPLLVVYGYEIVEHLLANLDECLIAKVISCLFFYCFFVILFLSISLYRILVFESCPSKSYYLVN